MRKIVLIVATVIGLSLTALSIAESQPPESDSPYAIWSTNNVPVMTLMAPSGAFHINGWQITPDDPVMPPEVPDGTNAAVDKGKELVELAKAKKWFAMSAVAIWLVMSLIKVGRKNLGFMQKLPKRALWIIVPVLSVAAMVLAVLQDDLSWGAGVAVLFSGPSVAFLNDLVKRGILGKEPSPMRPNGT